MNEEPLAIYTQSSLTAFSRKIRTLRKARGWTLLDIERESKGVITAVSMGAYERGARSLSLSKSIEIANLFDQPLSAMLDQSSACDERSRERAPLSDVEHKTRTIVDLRALYKTPYPDNDPARDLLKKYVKEIAHRRNDWNGEVISLREGDLEILSLALAMGPQSLYIWLTQKSLLLVAH